VSDGIRHFWTNIAGVKYWNADGTSRQRVLRELPPFTPVKLEEEPDNLHDPNAVRVVLQDGRQLGYLPRDVASEVTHRRQDGCWHRALIGATKLVTASQTGGQVAEGGSYLRIDVLVAEAEDYVTDAELCEYLDAVAAKSIVIEPEPIAAPAAVPQAVPVQPAATRPSAPIPKPHARGFWQWCRSIFNGKTKESAQRS
jgi:hypothetical protein